MCVYVCVCVVVVRVVVRSVSVCGGGVCVWCMCVGPWGGQICGVCVLGHEADRSLCACAIWFRQSSKNNNHTTPSPNSTDTVVWHVLGPIVRSLRCCVASALVWLFGCQGAPDEHRGSWVWRRPTCHCSCQGRTYSCGCGTQPVAQLVWKVMAESWRAVWVPLA